MNTKGLNVKYNYTLLGIPGVSEPISIEVKPIPEDAVIAFTGILERLNKDGFVDPKDIE